MYTYKAEVIKVVDGDTIDVDIDLGFGTWQRNVRLRLNRIDAYETRLYKGTTEAEKQLGLAGKEYVRQLCDDNPTQVTVTTTEKGKYGRWIAEVMVRRHTDDISINISDELVKLGYAVYKEY